MDKSTEIVLTNESLKKLKSQIDGSYKTLQSWLHGFDYDAIKAELSRFNSLVDEYIKKEEELREECIKSKKEYSEEIEALEKDIDIAEKFKSKTDDICNSLLNSTVAIVNTDEKPIKDISSLAYYEDVIYQTQYELIDYINHYNGTKYYNKDRINFYINRIKTLKTKYMNRIDYQIEVNKNNIEDLKALIKKGMDRDENNKKINNLLEEISLLKIKKEKIIKAILFENNKENKIINSDTIKQNDNKPEEKTTHNTPEDKQIDNGLLDENISQNSNKINDDKIILDDKKIEEAINFYEVKKALASKNDTRNIAHFNNAINTLKTRTNKIAITHFISKCYNYGLDVELLNIMERNYDLFKKICDTNIPNINSKTIINKVLYKIELTPTDKLILNTLYYNYKEKLSNSMEAEKKNEPQVNDTSLNKPTPSDDGKIEDQKYQREATGDLDKTPNNDNKKMIQFYECLYEITNNEIWNNHISILKENQNNLAINKIKEKYENYNLNSEINDVVANKILIEIQNHPDKYFSSNVNKKGNIVNALNVLMNKPENLSQIDKLYLNYFYDCFKKENVIENEKAIEAENEKAIKTENEKAIETENVIENDKKKNITKSSSTIYSNRKISNKELDESLKRAFRKMDENDPEVQKINSNIEKKKNKRKIKLPFKKVSNAIYNGSLKFNNRKTKKEIKEFIYVLEKSFSDNDLMQTILSEALDNVKEKGFNCYKDSIAKIYHKFKNDVPYYDENIENDSISEEIKNKIIKEFADSAKYGKYFNDNSKKDEIVNNNSNPDNENNEKDLTEKPKKTNVVKHLLNKVNPYTKGKKENIKKMFEILDHNYKGDNYCKNIIANQLLEIDKKKFDCYGSFAAQFYDRFKKSVPFDEDSELSETLIEEITNYINNSKEYKRDIEKTKTSSVEQDKTVKTKVSSVEQDRTQTTKTSSIEHDKKEDFSNKNFDPKGDVLLHEDKQKSNSDTSEKTPQSIENNNSNENTENQGMTISDTIAILNALKSGMENLKQTSQSIENSTNEPVKSNNENVPSKTQQLKESFSNLSSTVKNVQEKMVTEQSNQNKHNYTEIVGDIGNINEKTNLCGAELRTVEEVVTYNQPLEPVQFGREIKIKDSSNKQTGPARKKNIKKGEKLDAKREKINNNSSEKTEKSNIKDKTTRETIDDLDALKSFLINMNEEKKNNEKTLK